MAKKGNLELELVQVVFRHGARACSKSEAKILGYNDPKLYEPWGYEELTDVGIKQMYKLGCFLRRRYGHFLGHYEHREVYANTSDFNRTKMSLQLVLAGLYPPIGHLDWDPDLKWYPIPYHYVTKDSDVLFRSRNSPSFLKMSRNIITTPDFLKEVEKYAPVIELINKNTNNLFKSRSLLLGIGVFNVLNSHKFANIPLPDWCDNSVFKDLRDLSELALRAGSYSAEMIKINGGPLIRRLYENMSDQKGRKIYLYSGHDLNVSAYVNGLNLPGFGYSEFGCGIIVETLRDTTNNKKYIRMHGWSGVDEDSFVLKLRDQDEFCEFNDYEKIIQPIIPSDEDLAEIQRNISMDKEGPHSSPIDVLYKK